MKEGNVSVLLPIHSPLLRITALSFSFFPQSFYQRLPLESPHHIFRDQNRHKHDKYCVPKGIPFFLLVFQNFLAKSVLFLINYFL